MSDRFKILKVTVSSVLDLSKSRKDYKEVYDRISTRQINDIFHIIDKHTNDPKSIQREFKKYINRLFE
jgi:hypothetical protein